MRAAPLGRRPSRECEITRRELVLKALRAATRQKGLKADPQESDMQRWLTAWIRGRQTLDHGVMAATGVTHRVMSALAKRP